MHTVSSLLNGRPVEDAPGGRRQIPNPANLADHVSEALLGDADTFVRAAHAAAEAQAGWAAVPAPVRGEVIQHLGELVAREQGGAGRADHPRDRQADRRVARRGAGGHRHLRLLPREGRRLYGQTVPSEMPDKQLFTFRTPVGAAAIITAGNFPVAVPSWYIVPALLCGNTVVWKPAEYTPAIAEAFAQLILHAGVPTGVFQMVLADGPTTFAGLERAIEDGSIDKVGFTGSTDGRRRGSASCAGDTCSRRVWSSAGRTRSS